MKMRNLVLAAGATMGLSGAAMAQSHAFPVYNPDPSLVGNTWRNHNLGAAPAGNYSSYIVMLDWTSVGAGNGWSNEARSTLSSLAADANTLATPSYPVGNTVYGNNLAAATGSVGTTANRSNIYWTGNLAAPYAGGSDMYLNFRQSFSSTNMNWSNVRVVLNPTVNAVTSYSGPAAPTNFTDLGTLGVGSTNLSINVPAAQTGSWYRFSVDGNVSNALNNAFDIFSAGAVDTRLHVFRQTANGLAAVATTDDIAGATNRNGGATFGSSDPAAFGRDTYSGDVPGGATFFNGRGGVDLVANIPTLTNTAGAGELLAGETYWIWTGFWSGSNLTVATTNSVLNPDPTTFDIVTAHAAGFNGDVIAGEYTLELRSVPAPGAIALLGMGGLLATRRRR